MRSVSIIIFHNKQRNSGDVPETEKCAIISFSLLIEAQFLYSSSTAFCKNVMKIIIIFYIEFSIKYLVFNIF